MTAIYATRTLALYKAKYSASMAFSFSHFFEKPFVRRINRRLWGEPA